MRWLAPVPVLSLCATWLLCPATAAAQSATKTNQGSRLEVGQLAPAFQAATVDGRRVSTAGLRGKTTLIILFSTHCSACRAELQYLQARLTPALKSRRLRVIAIGRDDTKAGLVAFRRTHKTAFELVADPDRRLYGLFAKLRVPRTYLLDAAGRLVHQTRDFTEAQSDEVVGHVTKLLQNAPHARGEPATAGAQQ